VVASLLRRLCDCMFARLLVCLVGCLFGRLSGWSHCCLVDWLVGQWLALNWLVRWSIGWLVDWLIGLLARCLAC
jgi:hypothetical protein